MTTNGTTNDNDWQWVLQQMATSENKHRDIILNYNTNTRDIILILLYLDATSDNKWQRVTKYANEWQRMTASDKTN